jgi:hypothetical protein
MFDIPIQYLNIGVKGKVKGWPIALKEPTT